MVSTDWLTDWLDGWLARSLARTHARTHALTHSLTRTHTHTLLAPHNPLIELPNAHNSVFVNICVPIQGYII